MDMLIFYFSSSINSTLTLRESEIMYQCNMISTVLRNVPVHENINYLLKHRIHCRCSRDSVLGALNIKRKKKKHLRLNVVTATVKEGELQKCHMWNINVSFRITPKENVQYPLFLFLSHIFIQYLLMVFHVQ